ncbi:Peptidyl-prolyl cis-trans isomerase CWC27 like protein [Eufriesea mexicana]|uniref:Peptidyl-prolyl cis-trans isomerase CWC27 like protein n=1 Tax=Eufriesea mexicana TaxID=516756 RepID=A0A310SAE8_9HYME|nr:Peptidyl-prolyl cis-trans isomerase CWC27 like protein [Eufriesea mexicana]
MVIRRFDSSRLSFVNGTDVLGNLCDAQACKRSRRIRRERKENVKRLKKKKSIDEKSGTIKCDFHMLDNHLVEHGEKNGEAEVYKEYKEIRMKAVRRGTTNYVESRNRKEAAYVSTEKELWHRHANMRIIEEMENEHLIIARKGRLSYMITFLSTRFNSCGRDNNASQFLFTLGSTSELQSKHTIFGKVTGEPIYNMLKLVEALVDEQSEEVKNNSKTKTATVKLISYMFAEFCCDSTILYNEKLCYRNFNPLSFGELAKEDEEESVILNKKFSGKKNEADDHLTDPKLSSQPAVEPPGLANKKRKEDHSSDWESDDEVETQEVSNEGKDKKYTRDTKKEPKKVQNYKIDDVEDDKGIKENE